MHTLESAGPLHTPETQKEVVDISTEFLSLPSYEFLDLLRKYRKSNVELRISVPWSGNETMGIRLKAFLETATDTQLRRASITGTNQDHQDALAKPHMANVLNSGVDWVLTE